MGADFEDFAEELITKAMSAAADKVQIAADEKSLRRVEERDAMWSKRSDNLDQKNTDTRHLDRVSALDHELSAMKIAYHLAVVAVMTAQMVVTLSQLFLQPAHRHRNQFAGCGLRPVWRSNDSANERSDAQQLFFCRACVCRNTCF